MARGDLDATVLRERMEGMAYLALCQLRDLDPEAEPAYFRVTRLELHQRIDDDTEPIPPPGPERPRHLASVQ
ncbi:MAG: hypothetical protein ACRDLL_03320 [Solirubrobacterales bacterium]